MGQKRSQKDRAYVTASEWREEGGGYKTSARASAFKRLPFYCCAITFQPFEDPVCCGSDGTVMDIVNAVPYVQKHRKHPVTGQPLELRDLIKLHFTKNSDEEFVCPVLGKVFNENSHIVAIKPTGNVYSWEAIQKLCLEPKNLRDLLTDEPFQKKDIIHIQDPLNVSGRNMVEFDHVKRGLNAETTSDEKGGGGGEGGGVNNKKKKADSSLNTTHMSEDLKRALGTLGSLDEATEALRAGGGGKKAQAERLLASAKTLEMRKGFDAGKNSEGDDPRLKSAPRQPVEAAFKPGASTWDSSDSAAAAAAAAAGTHITRATTFLLPGGTEFDPTGGRRIPKPYSQSVEDTVQTTGAASRAFTSTFEAPTAKNVRVKRIVQLKPTKKGYVRLHTSAGQLNIELCADLCPKTCENFIALCESGYYNNTVFHRSIKNFMVQGGDPTGTGKGGVSIWGRTFEDEFDSRLTHGGRGVVSMANSGKSTNGSQFFILYKSAHHLDFKHAVFGKVVGGFETLTAIEGIPTDEEDRPVEKVEIKKAEVFVNPYKEMLEEEEEKVRQVNKKKETYQNTTHVPVPGGVGKYIIAKNTKLGFDDW